MSVGRRPISSRRTRAPLAVDMDGVVDETHEIPSHTDVRGWSAQNPGPLLRVEAVAEPGLGDEQGRTAGIGLELAADAREVDPPVVGLDHGRGASATTRRVAARTRSMLVGLIPGIR